MKRIPYIKNLINNYKVNHILTSLLLLIDIVATTILLPVLIYKAIAVEKFNHSKFAQCTDTLNEFLEVIQRRFHMKTCCGNFSVIEVKHDSGALHIETTICATSNTQITKYQIQASSRFLLLPLDILKPLLVHEIAHMCLESKYMNSDPLSLDMESWADDLVILNGYDIITSLQTLLREQLLIGRLLDAYTTHRRLKRLL